MNFLSFSLSLLQSYRVNSPPEAPAAVKENGSPVSFSTPGTNQSDRECGCRLDQNLQPLLSLYVCSVLTFSCHFGISNVAVEEK